MVVVAPRRCQALCCGQERRPKTSCLVWARSGHRTKTRRWLRPRTPPLSRTYAVETMGLEPTTPCLQSRCSSQLSYVPAIMPLTCEEIRRTRSTMMAQCTRNRHLPLVDVQQRQPAPSVVPAFDLQTLGNPSSVIPEQRTGHPARSRPTWLRWISSAPTSLSKGCRPRRSMSDGSTSRRHGTAQIAGCARSRCADSSSRDRSHHPDLDVFHHDELVEFSSQDASVTPSPWPRLRSRRRGPRRPSTRLVPTNSPRRSPA
jgi:hypothetical protein